MRALPFLFMGIYLILASDQPAKAVESFWGLELSPPIMVDAGPVPQGAPSVVPARITVVLEETGKRVSGKANWVYSDCDMQGGGPLQGSFSSGHLDCTVREAGGKQIQLHGSTAGNGVISGDATTTGYGEPSNRTFRLIGISHLKGHPLERVVQERANADNIASIARRALSLTNKLVDANQPQLFGTAIPEFQSLSGETQQLKDDWRRTSLLSTIYTNLGCCYYNADNVNEAERQWSKALSLRDAKCFRYGQSLLRNEILALTELNKPVEAERWQSVLNKLTSLRTIPVRPEMVSVDPGLLVAR